MFEYLKTAFNLLSGLITQDVLIIASLIVLALLVLWIILSLAICTELKIVRGSKKLIAYFEENSITGEFSPTLYALVNKMPQEFVRSFKMWDFKGRGLPSDSFKQAYCVETPLYGGLYNQNRSLMSTAIHTVVIALAIFSAALISTETQLTGIVLAEALLVPMISYLLYRIAFYIYSTIRHYYYKLAVEKFNNLVDLLNEKYEKSLEDQKEQSKGELKIAPSLMDYGANKTNFILDAGEEDMEELDEKRGRGRPKKSEEEKEAEQRIENDADFARAIARAEKLMARLHKDLSDSQKRRTNHELNELMAKMAEYKKGKRK